MPTFTVVVGDRPTLVFTAESEALAWMAVEDEHGAIVEDLMVLQDEAGNHLWNGSDRLFVRKSTPDEYRVWRRTFDEASDDDEEDPPEEDDFLVFLIPVSDPTDDAFDDD